MVRVRADDSGSNAVGDAHFGVVFPNLNTELTVLPLRKRHKLNTAAFSLHINHHKSVLSALSKIQWFRRTGLVNIRRHTLHLVDMSECHIVKS